MTYTNYDNLIKNRTQSIRYEIIEKLCELLECEPNDLFVKVEDKTEEKSKTLHM